MSDRERSRPVSGVSRRDRLSIMIAAFLRNMTQDYCRSQAIALKIPIQAASSDESLAQEWMAFILSSRKPRSSCSLIRRSDKSLPKTCVRVEERKSYLRSMSLRRWVKYRSNSHTSAGSLI